ncbi:hypothetical protein BJY01DRAFT_264318 [Aspergillus pseudoustus]|uniref:C2H2-type domain-containing protein n=1 Tax=Aspergillus pseudoustus TaxID=1810923 RepID=A0ABR4JTJ4_9EURO
MDRSKTEDWSTTVFRVRVLPYSVRTGDDVARLLSARLGDVSAHNISVFSLATSLKHWEDPLTRVATIMFSTAPSLVQRDLDKQEWHVPARGHDRTLPDLILDTHFMGMTPLSDTSNLEDSYDCIAISGLASHPFGSWQPKGGDKRFMWIRDNLVRHARDTRVIIYGYDTKLDSSSSFQNINDLAKQLIDQLQAYREPQSRTPMVFLAHSLGGLVVKQALRTLADYPSDDEYKTLLAAVCGAIFFGVPNLGMEKKELQSIVQDNPNSVLIGDLSQRSNFIKQLREGFPTVPLHKNCKFFWAYETQESPTAVRNPDGRLSRDGRRAILVSPESATCGFVDTNPAVTFPIDATHSDMVKFSQDSHYYSIVRAKLSQILRSAPLTRDDMETETASIHPPAVIPPEQNGALTQDDLQGQVRSGTRGTLRLLPRSIAAELDKFKTIAGFTDSEEGLLSNTTCDVVHHVVRELQMEQELRRELLYMQRLEPFLVSMEQFGELMEATQLIPDPSHSMAFIWGAMKYILETTKNLPEALNSILTSYQSIGEQIPQLSGSQPLFVSHPYLADVLIMIYKDVLSFHAEIFRHLRRRQWTELFSAWWRSFTTTVNEITDRTARNRRLMENQVSFVDFETIRKDDLISARTLEREKEAQAEHCRDTVRHWLSPFNFELDHFSHREKRSVCEDPGRWLLDSVEYKTWASHADVLNPLLWLSGIPGAGKTVLASVVIDELSKTMGPTVVYFYCKYGDENRNSFGSLARSILAQLLNHNQDLLSYFHEKANRNDNAVLTSVALATEMLSTSLRSCGRAYIVIDGLDECGRAARKQITNWVRQLVDTLPMEEMGSIRCLFVSQEDGMAVEDFHGIPTIKILNRNSGDLSNFAEVWQQKIVTKFGIKARNMNIDRILSGRAKGMFIFAELFAKFLEDQLSIDDLEKHLLPDNLPVQLDNVYERILDRVREVRGTDAMKRIEVILGWMVCARRPLRWEEIQNAVCVDVDSWTIDYGKRLANSPRELFASLVECQSDGTIDLVHRTARGFLVGGGSVKLHEAHFSLAIRCISYLSFPNFDLERSDNDILSDALDGVHQLYDYASACWAMHLQDGLAEDLRAGDLRCLQEALERLVDARWSETEKPLPDVKRLRRALSPLGASPKFNQIIQAVAWAKKQSSQHGIGPSPDEALHLWQVTEKVRSVVETINSGEDEFEAIKTLYGPSRYKCPRVNCYYYHQGFPFFLQRNRHIKKHTRPYLCVVTGCPMEVFGYATEKELQKHLFDAHYIDEFDDTDEPAYPSASKEKTHKSGQKEASFKCPDCDKAFTQKKSLNRHINGHNSEKRFACDSCDKRFKRKEDCDRHRLTHGAKKYTCAGLLGDGTKWGCDTSFSRQDKLRDHFQSKKGLKCILPLVKEKQQAGGGGGEDLNENLFANQTGANAEVLLTAGKSLPPFHKFLELCGIHESGGASPHRVYCNKKY